MPMPIMDQRSKFEAKFRTQRAKSLRVNTTEAKLKAELMKLLRARLSGFVIIRHEDRFTSAIPDTSVTGNGRTSWWEAKYADPTIRRRGDQELMLQRLARAGYARYIIWAEINGECTTRIVAPRYIDDWKNYPEGIVRQGFDHEWILSVIQKVHPL